ncbi:MAG: MFS transporter [Candidatus Geothermincolia bacterium]
MDDRPIDTEHPDGEQAGSDPSTQVTLEISAFRKVLKNRDFMALWVGQGVSSIGDWVIVGVLLDSLNRLDPHWGVFWMMTFRFLPAFLFGLVAGAVVDRLERKTLMILCELARCMLVIALAFANSLVLICGLVFGIECFSLLFGPAKDSCIPDLVKKDEVMTANSMMSTSTYLTMALGTLIATVILGLAALIHKFPLVKYVVSNQATFQHQFAFIVDALTFLVSAMLLFTIAFPRRMTLTEEKFSARSVFADLKEGLSFMRTDPLTRGILGIMIVGFIGGGSLYVLGAPFAEQVLKSTGAKFTLILSMLMIGVVVGAGSTPWVSRRLPANKWFTRAVIGFGITMIVFSMVDFYPLSMVVIFIGGCLLGYLLVSAYTLLHQNLAEEIRGRVFAAMQTIMRTCLLVSMGVFAALQALFFKWIPYTAAKPVSKVLNLGLFSKSFYPSMIALMVGGAVVIVGGAIFMRSLHKFFKQQEGGQHAEEAGPAT